MRKSGWAAATGLGSLVLLLAACGGSSSTSNSAAGAASGQPSASSASSAPAPATTSVSAASTASQGGGSTASGKAKATPHKSVGPQPSGPADERSIPPIGTTVMIVQKSAIGFLLAEANHQVVYVYDKDKKGQPSTCTGTCAATWLPATGVPQAGPADHFPGQFGVIKNSRGVEQITYEGLPLYVLSGAKPLLTTGNGQGGVWHVVKLSASDVG
jgi:predicted lipoprotein with Yx(FWY)xxD motif